MNGWRNLHSQPFLKHDAEWDAECSSNLYFSNVSRMQLFPQNGSDSNAQPPFIWYKKVYAAMSNLAGESGMTVSGRLSCALMPWITLPFHLFKDWLIISVVDMVCSQSLQNIIPPLTLSYNSLCLAFWKQSWSFSLNIFSGISVLITFTDAFVSDAKLGTVTCTDKVVDMLYK